MLEASDVLGSHSAHVPVADELDAPLWFQLPQLIDEVGSSDVLASHWLHVEVEDDSGSQLAQVEYEDELEVVMLASSQLPHMYGSSEVVEV